MEGFWSISCAESWPSWFIRVGDLDIDYIFKCFKSSRFHNIQREMLSMFDWFGKPTVLGIPPRIGSKFGKHPVDILAFGWNNHEKPWFPANPLIIKHGLLENLPFKYSFIWFLWEPPSQPYVWWPRSWKAQWAATERGLYVQWAAWPGTTMINRTGFLWYPTDLS